MSQNEDVVLKISSKKDPGYAKSVAGAMTWQLREKGFFKVRAVKTDAVNTAVKAIAIVNQQTIPKAGVMLSMDLIFAQADTTHGEATAIAMTVQDADCVRPANFIEYKVSGKLEDDKLASKLAGAIAAPVRAGKGIRLRCIGPNAVYRAILATTIAKGYIYPNGLQAIVVPTWDSIPQSDGKDPVSLIQIEFWGKPLS
jgi:stage V sporulation protein SpoVS